MHTEPFYVSGTCSVASLGVYIGWNAHQDGFAARQCAYGEHDGVTLLLAGELYSANPPHTDEEPGEGQPHGIDPIALQRLYAEHGSAFVECLNGVFSGVLVDRVHGCVLLFNDRYGLDRVYWHACGDEFLFASEAKALLEVSPGTRAFDEIAVAQLLAHGCTLGTRSLFRDVSRLAGGSAWRFDASGACRRSKYFSADRITPEPEMVEESFDARFADVFTRALPAYVDAPHGVGISLTGGLDTRMIMAALRHCKGPVGTYTFSGRSVDTLDASIARKVATACALPHSVLRLPASFLRRYGEHVDRTVLVTDGAAGALNAHEIELNRQARQIAPVRLTGNFGGEILRGMSTFKHADVAPELVAPGFAAVVHACAEDAGCEPVHPVAHAAFREVPWHLFGSFCAARSQIGFRTPYMDNRIVELAFAAPSAIRASAGAALRFIDGQDARLSAIPTDRGLAADAPAVLTALRRTFAAVTFKLDYLHKEGLPGRLAKLDSLFTPLSALRLLDLHKFLPYRVWFRNELAGYATEVFTDARTQRLPFLNGRKLESIVDDHVAGRSNRMRDINAVLTLEAIDRLLIDAGRSSSLVESDAMAIQA